MDLVARTSIRCIEMHPTWLRRAKNIEQAEQESEHKAYDEHVHGNIPLQRSALSHSFENQ